jgi:hypothetical protein
MKSQRFLDRVIDSKKAIASFKGEKMMMNSEQAELYKKILAFEIGRAGVAFPFAARLARDNRWSPSYTSQVIGEYKKCLFLATVAGHTVVPSGAVDEAWHLHLTYTRSYWDGLCGRVLGKPLHHNPTEGGASQREFFMDFYERTLSSYERFFDAPPPSDIWPPSAIRFDPAGRSVHASPADYWFVPKPSFHELRRTLARFPRLSRWWLGALVLTVSVLVIGWSTVVGIAADRVNFLSVVDSPAIAPTVPGDGSISSARQTGTLELRQIFLGISVLCLVGSALYFTRGIEIARRPLYIEPGGERKTPLKNFTEAEQAWASGAVLLFPPFIICLSKFLPPFPISPSTYLFIIMIGFPLFCSIIIQIFKLLFQKRNYYYCKTCKQNINFIDISDDLLTRVEIVAKQIKSVSFQGLYCEKCYPVMKRSSIYLYRHRVQDERFDFCPDCYEFTMVRTEYRVLKEATKTEAGATLSVYECKCCSKRKEKTSTIPQISEPEPIGCVGCTD